MRCVHVMAVVLFLLYYKTYVSTLITLLPGTLEEDRYIPSRMVKDENEYHTHWLRQLCKHGSHKKQIEIEI
jgi:hypothetical protein